MASESQIAANRRNAQKSTGPLTPEGKAAVRLNSLRHGLYADATVLPGENQAAFDQLCANLRDEWQPQGHTQAYLVDQMAASEWNQARLARDLPGILAEESNPFQRFIKQDKLDQYLSRLQRSHSRALKELRSLQKGPPKPALPEDGPEDQEPAKDAEPAPEEEQFARGWCWLDGKGHAQIISLPAYRSPDGKWHDLPESEWNRPENFPEEWKLVAPPILHASLRSLILEGK